MNIGGLLPRRRAAAIAAEADRRNGDRGCRHLPGIVQQPGIPGRATPWQARLTRTAGTEAVMSRRHTPVQARDNRTRIGSSSSRRGQVPLRCSLPVGRVTLTRFCGIRGMGASMPVDSQRSSIFCGHDCNFGFSSVRYATATPAWTMRTMPAFKHFSADAACHAPADPNADTPAVAVARTGSPRRPSAAASASHLGPRPPQSASPSFFR